MTTQEKNEVIAVFCGMRSYSSGELLYHSDYNWLMAAWKKFRSVDIDTLSTSEEWDHLKSLNTIVYHICNSDIGTAFEYLVSCVQWYNSVTEKQQP